MSNFPTKNTAVVEQALSRLLAQYQKADVLKAIAAAVGQQVQDIEDCAFDLLTKRSLGVATGYMLDIFGAILNVSRGGRTDDEYRSALWLRVAQLNSQGTIEEIISIVRAISGSDNIRLIETGVANFIVEVQLDSYTFLVLSTASEAVKNIRAAGVGSGLVIIYTGDYFGFLENTDGGTFGDVNDAAVGSPMVDMYVPPNNPVELNHIVFKAPAFGFLGDSTGGTFGDVEDAEIGAPMARVV